MSARTAAFLKDTFASLLTTDGRPIAYVQRQLGHAAITPTVDTYGKWLPMADKNAVDALDDPAWHPSGSKMVAKATGDDLEAGRSLAGPAKVLQDRGVIRWAVEDSNLRPGA